MVNLGRLLSAALLTMASSAVAQPARSPASPPPQPVSQEDRAFLSYAAEDNQAEIALCLIAEKKARSPALLAFARLMVDDHVEIESRLAAVAAADGVALPEGVGEDGKKTHDKLDPLSGTAFEKAFVAAQIDDHSNDLKKFAHEAATTRNEGLRQFASETGPLLQQHLALAKAIHSAMGG